MLLCCRLWAVGVTAHEGHCPVVVLSVAPGYASQRTSGPAAKVSILQTCDGGSQYPGRKNTGAHWVVTAIHRHHTDCAICHATSKISYTAGECDFCAPLALDRVDLSFLQRMMKPQAILAGKAMSDYRLIHQPGNVLLQAVRMADRATCPLTDRNLKDFILFRPTDFVKVQPLIFPAAQWPHMCCVCELAQPLAINACMLPRPQEVTIKDNTGRKYFDDDNPFPTLDFPSDHAIVATALRVLAISAAETASSS